MQTAIRHIITSAAFLALFAMIGVSLVSGINALTEDRIEQNERQVLIRSLNELLATERYNNDLLHDVKEVTDERINAKAAAHIYLARFDEQPVAAVMNVVAPDGYSGKIHLLVGVRYDGTLSGVRVVSHKETPGLGDAIEKRRSDWIDSFNDKSLLNPEARGWKVKKDGGEFDQFTGATITPRAIVKAVHLALQYFSEQRETLFAREAHS